MPSEKQILKDISDELVTGFSELTDRAEPGMHWTTGEVLTCTNAVLLLTEAIYGDRTIARVQVQDQPIRFRYHGGDVPSATAGEVAIANAMIILENADEIAQFRAFRDGGTDATLEIHYGRRP